MSIWPKSSPSSMLPPQKFPFNAPYLYPTNSHGQRCTNHRYTCYNHKPKIIQSICGSLPLIQQKKQREPTSLTSNEEIPQQGKERWSCDHSQECIDPMASSTTISTITLTVGKTWLRFKTQSQAVQIPRVWKLKGKYKNRLRGIAPNAKPI